MADLGLENKPWYVPIMVCVVVLGMVVWEVEAREMDVVRTRELRMGWCQLGQIQWNNVLLLTM